MTLASVFVAHAVQRVQHFLAEARAFGQNCLDKVGRRVREAWQVRVILDANDVVMSYYVEWDAASPLHKGRTGAFDYFSGLWGGFMNAKPATS